MSAEQFDDNGLLRQILEQLKLLNESVTQVREFLVTTPPTEKLGRCDGDMHLHIKTSFCSNWWPEAPKEKP